MTSAYADNDVVKVYPGNYIAYSQYLTTGERRVAQLAPQLKLVTEEKSSIQRPVLYTPPKTDNVSSFTPTHTVFADANENYCTREEFRKGRC